MNIQIFFKELTSDGIISYFEDTRTTAEELQWFNSVLTDKENLLTNSYISKYNWARIKKAFAKQFFPEIAPIDTPVKKISIEDRLNALFANC